MFEKTFKGKLIPKYDRQTKQRSLNVPIKEFWKRGQQVILIYNDEQDTDNNMAKNEMELTHSDLWSKNIIHSKWINADNLKDFKERLQDYLKTYDQEPSKLFFYPVQLSSSLATIKASVNPFNKGYKSLEYMSNDVNKLGQTWLPQWKGKPGVVVVDFENEKFNKAIVDMNVKNPN